MIVYKKAGSLVNEDVASEIKQAGLLGGIDQEIFRQIRFDSEPNKKEKKKRAQLTGPSEPVSIEACHYLSPANQKLVCSLFKKIYWS